MVLLSVIALVCGVVGVGVSNPVYQGGYYNQFNPYAGAFAFGGSGFPFGGGYSGVSTSVGGYPGFWPPFRQVVPFPVFPFPAIPFQIINWYEGPNVCKEVRTEDGSKQIDDWMQEVSGSGNYQQESESCKGTNTKYVCLKRVNINGTSKMQATKYECCHGFVRNPSGPGCVENAVKKPSEPAASSPQASGSAINPNDKIWYNIVPNTENTASQKS